MDCYVRCRSIVFKYDFCGGEHAWMIRLDSHRDVDRASGVGSAYFEGEGLRIVRTHMDVSCSLLRREVYSIAVFVVRFAQFRNQIIRT